MTSLYLHVGQAGCQLGQTFWSPLADDIAADAALASAFCHPRCGVGGFASSSQRQHRSIFVDTEPKPLRDSLRRIGSRRIGPCLRLGKFGRGSLHPMGRRRLGLSDDDDEAFDFLRREAERLDILSAVVTFHSLGGGTGSGLGCRMLRWMRDSFPLVNLLSVALLGSRRESPVQNYNATLATAALQRLCDAILLFEDEGLGGSGNGVGGFEEINREIALSLHGLFLPCALSSDSSPNFPINFEPSELVRSVCPMPSFKLLHAETVVRSSSPAVPLDLSTAVIRAMKRRRPQGLKLLSTAVVTRNGASFGVDDETKLTSSLPFVAWNPFPVDAWRGELGSPYANGKPCYASCVNSNRWAPTLTLLAEKTRRLLAARAFLHWFEREGCDREEIEAAGSVVVGVAEEYERL